VTEETVTADSTGSATPSISTRASWVVVAEEDTIAGAAQHGAADDRPDGTSGRKTSRRSNLLR
jgi:hypothetical protein